MSKYISIKIYKRLVLAALSFRANVLFFIAMSLLFLGIANENHQYWVMAQETSFQMPSTVGSSFNLYENATFGIKFQFPSSWNKVEILSGRITDIKFVLPVSQNASDTSPISIDIIIEKNLQNITSLDQYSRLTDNLLKTTLGSAFQITNDTHATILGGLPAMERSFIVKQSTIGAELGVKQAFTIKNNNAYIITYTAELTKYFDYLPIVDQLTKSFEITK